MEKVTAIIQAEDMDVAVEEVPKVVEEEEDNPSSMVEGDMAAVGI